MRFPVCCGTRRALYFAIFCGLIVALPKHLAAQLPYGTFTSQSNGQTLSSSAITVTWKGCSNATQSVYQTYINGVSKTTTQSSGQQCPDYSIGKNYSASGTLSNGANTLHIHVCDISGCGDATITVYYYVAAVSVTPDGATAPSVPQRTTGSYGFTVTNTGGLSATAQLAPTCAGAVASCSVAPTSVLLAAGASVTATVSYTGATVGTGTATLKATYNEYPTVSDNGYVNVTVTENPIWGVSVVPINATQSVSAGTALIAFNVTNTSQYTSTHPLSRLRRPSPVQSARALFRLQ